MAGNNVSLEVGQVLNMKSAYTACQFMIRDIDDIAAPAAVANVTDAMPRSCARRMVHCIPSELQT